jgi:pyruvate formate lyase activating enzyme
MPLTRPLGRREFITQCGRCAVLCAGFKVLDWAVPPSIRADGPGKGYIGRKLSPYFSPLGGGRIRCELCPRQCEVDSGERGYCRVRQNQDGQYYSLVYGNPCAVRIDPVEKKPFFHVLPGTLSFSIATAGCNLNCKFCQNWEISQAKPDDTFNYQAPPEAVVENAVRAQCASIASTYVEPTIFIEYMMDIGKLAKSKKLLNVMHSNGYINPAPLADLCGFLDAACIDLKGFSDGYYREMTEGTLEPVLTTLKKLKQLGIHTEIVNLVVPGKNDGMDGIRAMCGWIRKELGPETPLHFSRFHPLYKLQSLQPTPVATLEEAWKTARDEGLAYVYIGNVPGHPSESTVCPKCRTVLIERIGYTVKGSRLRDGKCEQCGHPVPGIWKYPEANA